MEVYVSQYKDSIIRKKEIFISFLKENEIKIYLTILDTMYSFEYFSLEKSSTIFNFIFKYNGFMHITEDISMLFVLLFS